jgi:hypothetical protein
MKINEVKERSKKTTHYASNILRSTARSVNEGNRREIERRN